MMRGLVRGGAQSPVQPSSVVARHAGGGAAANAAAAAAAASNRQRRSVGGRRQQQQQQRQRRGHIPNAIATVELGTSGLIVPRVCLGTMLFGESTGEAEAFELMSMAADAGAAFFDSAEMYPVPQRAETAGRSEEVLGRWLRGRKRESVVVATKAAGPSGQMAWLRGGPASLDAANIAAALDGSLRRLGTDYIDLYQLHWPDRYVPMFGETDYDPTRAYASVPLEEQLEALGRAVAAGKVRAVGLSNETPWGLLRALHLAERCPGSVPRVAALQNAYSLVCRTFDSSGLAEACHLERVGLLAYSPLAMGWLTGKYHRPDGGPPEARLNRYRGRYAEAEARYAPREALVAAVKAYCEVAARHGMSPAELALRFVLGRPLVAAAVVGATSRAQLAELLAAAARPPLADGVTAELEAVHERWPSPAP